MNVRILIPGAFLLLLPFAGLIVPEFDSWGFNHLRYLPPGYLVLSAGLCVVVIAVASSGKTSGLVVGWLTRLSLDNTAVLAVLLASFVSLCLAFRIDPPLLGDSWFILKNFAGINSGTDVLVPRDEPLATYILNVFTRIAAARSVDEFRWTFTVVGLLLGFVFFTLVKKIVKEIFSTTLEQTVVFLLILFHSATLLFFGYIETYVVVLVAVAFYVLYGVRYIAGKGALITPTILFLVQAGSHYLTILTLPSLIYLWAVGFERKQKFEVLGSAGILILSVVIFLSIAGWELRGLRSVVPHQHYLPLSLSDAPAERYSTAYTLQSLLHLVDLLNLVLLLVPGLIFIVSVVPPGFLRTFPPGRDQKILYYFLLMLLPIVAFILVAKYDAGMARDWDIVSPFTFLIYLCGGVILFRYYQEKASHLPVLLLVGTVVLHSILWYSVNASPGSSLGRFKSLLDDPRRVSQGALYSGSLYLSSYFLSMNMPDSAMPVWEKYRSTYPADGRAYVNVLRAIRLEEKWKIPRMIREWIPGLPDTGEVHQTLFEFAHMLGNTARENKDYGFADSVYVLAQTLDSTNPKLYYDAGRLKLLVADTLGAEKDFERSLGIDGTNVPALLGLAVAKNSLGKRLEGIRALEVAESLGSVEATGILYRLRK